MLGAVYVKYPNFEAQVGELNWMMRCTAGNQAETLVSRDFGQPMEVSPRRLWGPKSKKHVKVVPISRT
jgi:hypothetical protein